MATVIAISITVLIEGEGGQTILCHDLCSRHDVDMEGVLHFPHEIRVGFHH